MNVKELIKNKKTYPSWSSGSEYPLFCQEINKKEVLVYYTINYPIKRRIERIFPKEIQMDLRFAWALGFIKGEGANALGKSNYRRFTLTNTNFKFINICLDELENKKLLLKKNIKNGAFHIIHSKSKSLRAISFWSKKLGFSKNKFKYINDDNKTSKYGVCHLYVSDVLLRRIVDLLAEILMKVEFVKTILKQKAFK